MLAAKEIVQAPEEGQGTTTEQRSVEDVLGLLYRRSLMNQDKQTKRFSLHDLVRVFGLGRLEGEEVVRLRHAQHYARVAAEADELYMRGGENVLLGLKLFDRERANIDAGWQWAREQTGSLYQEIDELLLGYTGATAYVGNLRYDRRHERIPQLEVALGAARRLGSRWAEGGTLGTLGLVYAELGETHKAIQYHEQYLEIARQIGDRQGESIALGNLGNTYVLLGEPRKAIEYYEQALKIDRERSDRRNEGNVLGNLGVAYRDLGETGQEIPYYEQQLEITREIGDRLGESKAYWNLAGAYRDLGETGKAIRYYEQQLEIAYQMGYRQGEAFASWELGMLLAEEGDVARAVKLMQFMVDYKREIGHPDAEKDAAKVEQLRKRLA
jgi:tetratricopeptide (TPR) repeat protein